MGFLSFPSGGVGAWQQPLVGALAEALTKTSGYDSQGLPPSNNHSQYMRPSARGFKDYFGIGFFLPSSSLASDRQGVRKMSPGCQIPWVGGCSVGEVGFSANLLTL